MAKKYCRYCAYCINADLYYCTEKEQVLSDKAVHRVTNCSSFELSPLGDVDTGAAYKPRQELTEDEIKAQQEFDNSQLRFE